MVPPSWDLDVDTLDNAFMSYDDLLRDVRDYTGVPDFTTNIPDNHEYVSGVSVDPQVQGLVERIRLRQAARWKAESIYETKV